LSWASGRRSAERGSGHSLLVVAQPARILAANGRLRGRMAVSRPSIRREGAGSAPATQPSPPNSVGLRWSTWRRFDPSSSPSASLPKVVCSPGDLVGNKANNSSDFSLELWTPDRVESAYYSPKNPFLSEALDLPDSVRFSKFERFKLLTNFAERGFAASLGQARASDFQFAI
jgi:hypothetical protein